MKSSCYIKRLSLWGEKHFNIIIQSSLVLSMRHERFPCNDNYNGLVNNFKVGLNGRVGMLLVKACCRSGNCEEKKNEISEREHLKSWDESLIFEIWDLGTDSLDTSAVYNKITWFDFPNCAIEFLKQNQPLIVRSDKTSCATQSGPPTWLGINRKRSASTNCHLYHL